MSKVKIMRDFTVLEIETEEMKKGDVFAVYDGSLLTCSDEPIYDDEEDCFYVQCGIELYSEALLVDIKEMKMESRHSDSLEEKIQSASKEVKERRFFKENKHTNEKFQKDSIM